MAQIEAVNSNGVKQLIPEHWLNHPTLGKGFKRSRRRQAQTPPAPREAAPKSGGRKAGSTSATNTKTAPGADQEG